MTSTRIILAGSLLLLCGAGMAQTAPVKRDTVRRESHIRYEADDNAIRFSAVTPPLQQVQGAPQAFYTYYWEFGDGAYSTEPTPEHVYTKPGEHTVRLWTTNHYDAGKPPASRPEKVPVKKTVRQAPTPQARLTPDGLLLRSNREPVPGEEMVMVLSYANTGTYATSGKFYVFFNERRFKADNFELTEARTHNGEKVVQPAAQVALHLAAADAGSMLASTLVNVLPASFNGGPLLGVEKAVTEAHAAYRNAYVLEFNDLAVNETRNVFYSFKTTPEMLKDTSARITIRGIYVPDRNTDKHESKSLEMEIVTSHDPNKMSVGDTRLNYRFYKNKDLDFKVRFQNNGKGPASSIKLAVDVPEVYNKQTLAVTNMYPPCPICPEGEVTYSCLDTLFVPGQIVFHFRNIYLPGSNQDNVSDYDSTKGFVAYTLRFNEKVAKRRARSRTAIVFDKNEPIYTNYAATRFKPGLSVGIKAGYGLVPSLNASRNYFAGITLSPYKPQRGYLQAEIMAAIQTHEDSLQYTDIISQDGGVTNLFDVAQRNKYRSLELYVVPVSYNYNIAGWLSVGGGVQFRLRLRETATATAMHYNYLYYEKQNVREPRRENNYASRDESTRGFGNLSPAFFGGLTLGSARIGPALGARYVYSVDAPHVQWQVYALWKF